MFEKKDRTYISYHYEHREEKKQRRIALILAAIMLSMTLLFCSCAGGATKAEAVKEEPMFVKVEVTTGYSIVYHRETKVMYVMSNNRYNYGSFCLLVNPDGTPMLYEG